MKTGQNGAALIEFALMLPLLLILMFITTEFGRAMYQYNTIAKSVRDAVRYMSVQAPGTHLNEARNLIVYGNIAGTGSPLAPGLSLSNVATTPTWQAQGTNPVINTVTVGVSNYSYQPLFSSVFGLNLANGNGAIPFSTIRATMQAPI